MADMQLGDLFMEARSNRIEWHGKTVFSMYEMAVDGPRVWVRILSHIDSPVQGIRITSLQRMRILDAESKKFILWADTAPQEFAVDLFGTAPHTVRFSNAWRGPHASTQSWIGNAGMLAEQSDELVVLRCSDGEGDPEFNDLTLQITTKARS